MTFGGPAARRVSLAIETKGNGRKGRDHFPALEEVPFSASVARVSQVAALTASQRRAIPISDETRHQLKEILSVARKKTHGSCPYERAEHHN